MKTYDMDKLPNYKLSYYHKPRQKLKTNWPTLKKFHNVIIKPYKNQDKVIWFVDNPAGITMSKHDNQQDAQYTAKAAGSGFTVRPYCCDELQEHQELLERKERFRQNI